MNLWQNIADNFSREARRHITLFLPEHRVHPVNTAGDATPIRAGKAYCRIWLEEMRLGRGVQWFRRRYPVVHTAVRFRYGGEPVTIPYIAAPGNLQQLGADNWDRVIQLNYPLTPLFPFNQGEVEFQAALFSMVASDPIGKFIKTMGQFSQLLPVPELSKVFDLAKPIYQGIEDLLDIGERKLELGYQQTFSDADGHGSNTLRAGYFVAILDEENDINSEELYVVDGRLKLGSPGTTNAFKPDSRSVEGSYMLFRLEKRTAQDWESLTSIKKLVDQAQEAMYAGNDVAVKTVFLPAIQTAIYRSPDVAKDDRRQMVLKIQDYFKQWNLESGEVQRKSLYSIMQRHLPSATPETEAELTALEKLFE